MNKNVERFPLTSLGSKLPRTIDILVCSASFEERCKSIPNALKGRTIPHVFICENRNSFAEVAANGRELRRWFGTAKSIMFDKVDPFYGADAFRLAMQPLLGSGSRRVVIDITTFTHESLLILLKILRDISTAEHDIVLLYSPAADYSVGDPPAEKWLCKGIKEIRTVLGYPGMMIPSRPVHLIVLVGFEADRTAQIIDTYEPQHLTLGCGEGTLSRSHHTLNREFFSVVAARYRGCAEFTFPPEDPIETSSIIERQIASVGNVNTVIAAMNTKLSTVGVALAVFKNDVVQLCYASARHYNIEHYSTPGEDVVLVTRALGR